MYHLVPLSATWWQWVCHLVPLSATQCHFATVSVPLGATQCHLKWHWTWSGTKWHQVVQSKSTRIARSLDLPGLSKGAKDHGWILEAQQQKRNPKPVGGETWDDSWCKISDSVARVGVHALGIIIIYCYLCCHGPVQEPLPGDAWNGSLLTCGKVFSKLNQRELRNWETIRSPRLGRLDTM